MNPVAISEIPIRNDVEESKSNTTLAENDERKPKESQTTLGDSANETLDEAADTQKFTSLPCKQSLTAGSRTPEHGDSDENNIPRSAFADSAEKKPSLEKLDKSISETDLENKMAKYGINQKTDNVSLNQMQLLNPSMAEIRNKDFGIQKKQSVAVKPSETSFGIPGRKSFHSDSKIGKSRPNSRHKKPSEIPKLKSLPKAGRETSQKLKTFQSKLPVKTTGKELEGKQTETVLDNLKNKAESVQVMMKSLNVKKDSKTNNKVKQAMAEDFGYLVPFYEREFKRISDVWMNTIYCSLTMRTNLVKLLFQAFPSVNRTQFYTEDERLLHCIANAKSCTKLEAENLIKFIKSLIANREKTKDDYKLMIANKEIAEYYNHDWRKLIRKMTGLGEEAKHLQMETPELQKKKEANEISTNDKIRRMEMNLYKKEDEIKRLINQLNMLKQKENSYKDNVLLKIPDYKEIKADVQSLIAVQREYDELKAKYLFQNYTYEKKIKDLENLVEEKKRILEKEREMKKQLQALLVHLQAHQKRLTTTIGREQVDFVMGRSIQDRQKRQEQLWLAAVKLVLRGFLIQMKKLERDRNKMLLEVQCDDVENSSDTAIIQKDNFIKSIKQQMNDLQKVCNCPSLRTSKC